MRTLLLAASIVVAGCLPKQDPGIPLPPKSGAEAMNIADQAIAPRADTVAAIDAARRVVAENVANADTTAYKAACCRVQNGRAEMYHDFEQGPLESTNRPLDIAIAGRGFFRVKVDPNLGDGLAYTRNGNLFTNRNGLLVVGTGDGVRLDPPISVPADTVDLRISEDGVVLAQRSGNTALETLGQIYLYVFRNPDGLATINQTLLCAMTDASGDAIESKPRENSVGALQQGFLEKSNVNLTREKLRAEFLDRWRDQVLRGDQALTATTADHADGPVALVARTR